MYVWNPGTHLCTLQTCKHVRLKIFGDPKRTIGSYCLQPAAVVARVGPCPATAPSRRHLLNLNRLKPQRFDMLDARAALSYGTPQIEQALLCLCVARAPLLGCNCPKLMVQDMHNARTPITEAAGPCLWCPPLGATGMSDFLFLKQLAQFLWNCGLQTAPGAPYHVTNAHSG